MGELLFHGPVHVLVTKKKKKERKQQDSGLLHWFTFLKHK